MSDPEELDASTGVQAPSAQLRARLLSDNGLLHRWTTIEGPIGRDKLLGLLLDLSPHPADRDAATHRAQRLLDGEALPSDHEILVTGGPPMFVFALTDGVLVGNWRPRELSTAEALRVVLDVGLTVCHATDCDAILEDEGGIQFAILRAHERRQGANRARAKVEAMALRGAEAIEYAGRHLIRKGVNPNTWETEYLDAQGRRWLMDYPDSGLHGGGSPRLRRCDDGPSDSTPSPEDE